ncbi:Pol protein [Phytophthora palmivora]|uniref:Pol protein n=1 Tax=Phytophthora palmivora TaxID=4796 RepID=A0A2P4YAU9_9STRA|nr:Pol protein [Phytophthora palmivora]
MWCRSTHYPNSRRIGEFGTRLISCQAQSIVSRGSGLYLASNAFFAEKAKSGMVGESKSPDSTPTFCVRKPNGKWRLVHAYNKLNNATVPAQTPIPRKDVHLKHLRRVFEVMRANKLYANIDKRVFAAEAIKALG